MIDLKIVPLLRCPLTGEPLTDADPGVLQGVNEAIVQGRLRDRSGEPVAGPIDGGLRAGPWLYPIRDGIPVLVADQAIAVDPC